jgi:hypothetical protein
MTDRAAFSSPLAAALAYLSRGWRPIPVPFRKKGPIGNAWQTLVITVETAPQHFNGQRQNIGVVLGPASGDLTDVDLDCSEAIAFAPSYLPKTAAVFGRASKQKSHRLYLSDLCLSEDKAAIQYRDPVPKIDPLTGKKTYSMLVELRFGGGAKGAQTVFPGSVHEGGEPILWDSDGDPPRVEGADLVAAVKKIAAASLLARHYPGAGSRHDGALTLGGVLARRGWAAAAIQTYVRRIAQVAGDDEWRERGTTAAGAVAQLQKDGKVRGLPKLIQDWGKAVAEKVAEWLDLGGGPPPVNERNPPLVGEQVAASAPLPAPAPVFSDEALALAFAERYEGQLRYIALRAQWVSWTGTHWRADTTLHAFDLSRQIAREFAAMCAKKTIATQLTSAKTVAAVERLARADRRLAAADDQWDRRPDVFNTPEPGA